MDDKFFNSAMKAVGITPIVIDENTDFSTLGNPFEEETVEVKPPFYTVAVYLCDRAYGGPEEGGWWYDCGQRVDDIRETPYAQPVIFGNELEDEAIAYCRRVNEVLNVGINKERRSDIGSVLSEGRYEARVCAGYPEPHFPAVRPHYE